MAAASTVKNKLEALGHWFFYKTLRIFGLRGGYLLLGPVIFCYVLFSRKIHSVVAPYLKHRFPEAGPVARWFYTLRNLYSFGQVLVERGWLGVVPTAELEGEIIGYDRLLELIEKKKGVVLLIAHVGNWQSALMNLKGLPVKVHAVMEYDREAVAKHYFDIQEDRERPFEIIDAKGPFGGLVEAANGLSRGEVVTIMGDRYVGGSATKARFLGEDMRFPDAAYLLAATAGSPVAVLLIAKTGMKSHQLKIWDVFYPEYQDRSNREAMLKACAQKYSTAIENYLKKYPFQWYNFFDFWKQ